MSSVGLIQRQRLALVPHHLRVSHEYCFSLHDHCVSMLADYEAVGAHNVHVQFRDKSDRMRFEKLAAADDPIAALVAVGFATEARKVMTNNIIMALTSDFLQHLYTALTCLEQRKVVVAFNLLRKPLKDNLAYLCWILADEDDFFASFITGNPEKITQKQLGNKRLSMFERSMAKTDLAELLDAKRLHSILNDRTHSDGFERLFQHAVHLVTVQHVELRTSAENFNFIFKDPGDDDQYDLIYSHLPALILFSFHVVLGLFQTIRPMETLERDSVSVRSIFAYRLLADIDAGAVVEIIAKGLEAGTNCPLCKSSLSVTRKNAMRILLTDRFRCKLCRRLSEISAEGVF